ncbi:MAG: divalent-cation tolerance protein CutA [Candidatus Nezhaarchaeales archaeon]|nr:MAG: divalent-cation tolerance protein CutA [Candidatus Nezhaarchaeota archaeon WYZ-LMO8]TDA36591.1 MAG: divalent-cation tolerance protein CutA [Candidatus Nezhaarchaeota archaeon WYZ-LMO7]
MIGCHLVVLITFPSKEEAYKVGRKLVEEGLAACVNVIEKVRSLFIFEGKFEECDEALAIVKTKLDVLQRLIEAVKSMHSYSVPEVIAIPIIAGYEHYLKWLEESIRCR